jgi:uncharacterized protein
MEGTMECRLIAQSPERTFAIVFDEGDEFVRSLTGLAQREGFEAAHFTAIGAFERAMLGYFDWSTKSYVEIPVGDQVEVVSLSGDVAVEKDRPKVHAHAVLARRDGTTVGGHVLEGFVRPTLEVVLQDAPAHLRRRHDEKSGLALIDLAASTAAGWRR